MPRNKRFNMRNITQLVVQDAPAGVDVMNNKADFLAMRRAMEIAAESSGTEIHAYSFTSNQIVMLLTPRQHYGVSRLMQSLGKRYIVHFHQSGREARRLWARRHRVIPVENDKFFLVTSHLLERVHLTPDFEPEDMPTSRSSFAENSGSIPLRVLTPHPLYVSLGNNWASRARAYRSQSETIDWEKYMGKIRDVVAGKSFLASEPFIHRLERESGTRLVPRKPGRPALKSKAHDFYSGALTG